MTAKESNKKGFSDFEQIKYAALEKRVLFTHNIADFSKIHAHFINKGFEHSGIIISRQLPIGVIVEALLKLVSNVNYENVRNNIIWLSDWITQHKKLP